ncbi:HAD family hydrolase [Aliarcobacter skirrowii]|uniref:HAD family hydrolase n=1 Tax=Aliarcobacter skirrowii TaxID=28200 RepID=UPI0029A7F767|nr:HAD family hydrolase [Aliarcobacter skirrowii]MDX4012119.1 HAD family hydrolase [Aliarcobacter skirrowii]MDX4065624.1 HAD family hydrolase [Aliarcobacter skirrowii]
MKIKVIVFDLDDTLYDEIEYVKSGFIQVANYFSYEFEIDKNLIYNYMIQDLETNGRGKIFDNMLENFKIYSKENIKKAILVYRTHKPNIVLPQESIEVLRYYNSLKIPIYIVTDGNKIVQNNKIEALKIRKYIKKDFITHRYGIKNSKPSTYCFLKIAQNENVEFRDIVYIGDNPNKDFVNIKKIGFRTIRIVQGMFKELEKPKEYEAELNIQRLAELKNIIIK